MDLRSKYEIEKRKRIDAAQKKLDGIIEQGNLFNERIEADESDIVDLEKKITEYETEKSKLQSDLDSKKAELEKLPTEIDVHMIPEYRALAKQYDNLNDVVLPNAVNATADVDTLKAELSVQKKTIQDDIDAVKTELAKKQQIEDAKDRVSELREELKKVTSEAAKCEKLDFLLEKFEKAKMNLLSERINQKFKVVQWKLFHTQKNGGIENVCVCMVHGSPYGENTTSTTERLMAGLDILNTLSEIYDVTAPIFIDNAEAYNSFNVPSTKAQMIQLFVSEDEEIKVVNE
jgi:chromosome segregation ATPase